MLSGKGIFSYSNIPYDLPDPDLFPASVTQVCDNNFSLQVKAQRGSENLTHLSEASKGVTEATASVVASAKTAAQAIEESGKNGEGGDRNVVRTKVRKILLLEIVLSLSNVVRTKVRKIPLLEIVLSLSKNERSRY